MWTKVINEGYHYPNPFKYFSIPLFKIIRKKKETIRSCYISFNRDCLYELDDENQLDQNKLFGFSTSLYNSSNNSMRFTWKANLKTRKIEIFAYEYLDGERKYEFLREVDIDEMCYFKITYRPMMLTTYYTINKKTWDSPFIRGRNRTSWLGYTLGFYFGGNEAAPQRISISKLGTIGIYVKGNK